MPDAYELPRGCSTPVRGFVGLLQGCYKRDAGRPSLRSCRGMIAIRWVMSDARPSSLSLDLAGISETARSVADFADLQHALMESSRELAWTSP